MVVGTGSNVDSCRHCGFSISDRVYREEVRCDRVGLWKVDNVSSEEWHRKQMRRHDIKQWVLTIIEIILMVGVVVGMYYLFMWASNQIHP